ncbi:hypothetical protein C8Q78DRAFT_1083504 [Trametes maxima]|nr:hypothetical protein C8Q78DRAFT_1083504 [Trametes maxima]
MDIPASALRRKSQVFVEIPPSPLVSSKTGSANPRVLQNNTPLKVVAMNVDQVEDTALAETSKKRKRKSMGASGASKDGQEGAQSPKPKKSKTDPHTEQEAITETRGKEVKEHRAEKKPELSEDAVRCHQCARQYEPSDVMHCTATRASGQRCVLKYCKPCMRNRYQEDCEAIKARGTAGAQADRRVADVNYIFSDTCNCRRCRKAKGLPPLGDLNLLARKATKAAATQEGQEHGAVPLKIKPSKGTGKAAPKKATVVPRPNPHASKPKPHVLIPPSPHLTRMKADTNSQAKLDRIRPKRARATRVIPRPVWTRLSAPLTYDSVLQRLSIREFLLRFAHLTDTARGHLEELEEVGNCTLSGGAEDDEDSGPSALASWISEPALKAILVGLLTILSKDTDSTDEAATFTKAVHGVKASGMNLNKLWGVLASLRGDSVLALPDPLPYGGTTIRHSTRRSSSTQDTADVFSTAQLVPVVDALIERTLETKAVREDFDRAVTQAKDLARAARELTAAENARWKSSPEAKNTAKGDKNPHRREHRDTLAAIEHAHQIASTECIPRFTSLGRDSDGRVYLVLTPGIVEREAAVDLLEGGKGDVKFGKRRGIVDEAQRRRMRHWSWHLAVWGRKPEDADVAKPDREDDDGEKGAEEDNTEGWWGFWQPEEVSKLAEWLAIKHDIDLEVGRTSKEPEDVVVGDVTANGQMAASSSHRGRQSDANPIVSSRSGVRTFTSMNRDTTDEEGHALESDDEDIGEQLPPRRQDLRALVKGLKEYADLLEWRVKRASKEVKGVEEKSENSKDGKGKGKDVQREDAIPTQMFYGA